MSELYMLDLRETAVAERVLSEGIKGIEAGNVHYFLTQHGFDPDPLEGVSVHANGLVSVWLETDPSEVWQDFANESPPADVVSAQTIDKLKAFREKSKDGRASAKDREEILDTVIDTMLRAYGIE